MSTKEMSNRDIQEKLISFFEREHQLGFCTKKYYERVKWYFETYEDELFGLSKEELTITE